MISGIIVAYLQTAVPKSGQTATSTPTYPVLHVTKQQEGETAVTRSNR
ncbi:MAG: hypothetical protein M5U34_29395 [Chloroflexi bacterium]|nr:hypothetical protein [Chloroflexota bacterium]